MESINNNKVKYRFLVFILAFMVAIAPLGNIKKVEALSPSDLKLVSPFIIGLILTSLVASGAVSGGYKVSPADLSSITEKAQANLQAAGATAVEQANKLGEAIKSGAESAKIKALASGAVIYAFLSAIQETLWRNTFNKSESLVPQSIYFASIDGYDIYWEKAGWASSYIDELKPCGFISGADINHPSYWAKKGNLIVGAQRPNLAVLGTLYVYDVNSKMLDQPFGVYCGGNYFLLPYSKFDGLRDQLIYKSLGVLTGNIVYDSSLNEVSEKSNIMIPTVLPSNVSDNINNWDGTSDLVLSPPLPYDIPDDEALVVDPTYGGEVIDPTDPVDPPAEEGTIVLPWLAALLGLLGLGNPSLEGIEAGVKTAIDKLIEGITATAQDVFDGSKEIFGNITDALTGIDAGIQSGIDALTGSISVPLANIADFALSVPDFFAIPEGKSIATPIIEQIPTVFPIVDQMNTALNKITVQTRPLIIYYPYLDGSTKEINLNWYEPAREQVKHGVGLLFKVVTALACFAMVSNVFGIGIRVGTGQAYTDNNSGGGGSGRRKED